MFEDRIKILALVSRVEMGQLAYFVSRARARSKSPSGILNTSKGQDGDGWGTEHTAEPRLALGQLQTFRWHTAKGVTWLCTNSQEPQSQERESGALCHFAQRKRSSTIFSAVPLLNLLVQLACGYFSTSINIHRNRRKREV